MDSPHVCDVVVGGGFAQKFFLFWSLVAPCVCNKDLLGLCTEARALGGVAGYSRRCRGDLVNLPGSRMHSVSLKVRRGCVSRASSFSVECFLGGFSVCSCLLCHVCLYTAHKFVGSATV